MRMHDGVHIRPLAVDEQVHRDLAGDFAPATELATMLIDDDQVVGLHHALAHDRGRAQQRAVGHAHGEVAVGCRHHATLMQHFAEAHDVVAVLLYRFHAVSPRPPTLRRSLIRYRIAFVSQGKVDRSRNSAGPLGHNRCVLVSDFDYHLPEELIAKQPLADRADARMLHLDRDAGGLRGSQLSRVPRASASGRSAGAEQQPCAAGAPVRTSQRLTGAALSAGNPAAREFLRGKVEVLLTRQLSASPQEWEALVHPGRKLGVGERVYFGGECSEESHELAAEIVDRGSFGERQLRFDPVDDFFGVLNRIGHIPLPPYIDRPDTATDREQYQTVYAKPPGSVAAPTAGLHFTPEILDRIRARGIEIAEVTLHVDSERFSQCARKWSKHKLHREWYEISRSRAEHSAGARCRAAHRRRGHNERSYSGVCGAADKDGRIVAQSGEADIFIYPGFEFRVVGAMLTNFHLPKSTLIMLVSAFAGRERTLRSLRTCRKGTL